VEGSAAERALDHNVERGDDPAGFAEILFPRLDGAREPQIRDGKSREAGLGLGAAAGGALAAGLAAGTSRRAGVRRDGGRVVVRLDLAEDVDRLVVRGVFVGFRINVEATAAGAGEDGGVVL